MFSCAHMVTHKARRSCFLLACLKNSAQVVCFMVIRGNSCYNAAVSLRSVVADGRFSLHRQPRGLVAQA